MSSQIAFNLHDNVPIITRFLSSAHNTQPVFLAQAVAEHIKCWGFPEFNPQNRDEYLGFFNYLSDVFNDMDFRIEQALADTDQVLVRFQIRGTHHEEFMGLPATGSDMTFSANALFRLDGGIIQEVWMYNKQVSIQTRKGMVYQLQARPGDNHCPQARACQ